jgi:hypothetical protein
MSEGPRGVEPRGPSSRQHRRQGSAGAWKRRRGVRRWSRPLAVGQCGCQRGDLGCMRIVLDETRRPQPSDPALRVFALSAGRPRASPEPSVLLGDRAAVPCRPVTSLERGPTTHGTIRTSHRSSEPRVVLSGPPLAGTDNETNERARGRSRAVRVRGVRTSVPGTRIQILPRHSSSMVIARAVPGLPSASL